MELTVSLQRPQTLTQILMQPNTKRGTPKNVKSVEAVINLSCHQKDVHGMTKMRRKLDDYFTSEKKTPKRKVKFCPLSPCKSLKTPIFQLHKHLQTSIHNLKPNSPSYLQALADAPRASVAKVNSYLKQQRKKEQKRKSKRDKTTKLTNTDGSIYSNEEEVGEKEAVENMVGACEEGVSRGDIRGFIRSRDPGTGTRLL